MYTTALHSVVAANAIALVWIKAYLHSTVENHYRQAHLMTYWAPMAKCVMEATHQAPSSTKFGVRLFSSSNAGRYLQKSIWQSINGVSPIYLTATTVRTSIVSTYTWESTYSNAVWKKVHFLWYMMMVLGVFRTEPEGRTSQKFFRAGSINYEEKFV